MIIWQLYSISNLFVYLEQRLLPDSFPYVDSDDDDNDVISNSDQRGLFDIWIFLIGTELYN